MHTVLLMELQDQMDLKKGARVKIEIANLPPFFIQFDLRKGTRNGHVLTRISRAKPKAKAKPRKTKPPHKTAAPSPSVSNGKPGAKVPGKRRTFTEEFRKSIVDEVLRNRKNGTSSYHQIANKHGLWPSVVHRWLEDAKASA